MSRECQNELQETMAQQWDVEVMTGKANLEVRRLVSTYNAESDEASRVEFVLCSGDDFTDEDMFRALNGMSGLDLKADHVFTVTVGASTKVTLAKWHLPEPEDVIDCAALLAGMGAGGAAQEEMAEAK